MGTAPRPRRRYRLTQAELQALFDALMRGPPFSADPEFGAFAAEGIALEIETVRWELRGPEPDPFLIVEEMDDGTLLWSPKPDDARRYIASVLANSGPPPKRPRGRPQGREARHRLIEQIFHAFGPRHAKLRQREGNRPGSHFEEVVALAMQMAGDPIVNVHRECLAVVGEIRRRQL